MNSNLTLACYYFPNYHPTDPRNQQEHGPGWTEWELVKAARPRFPGHRQPRVPLWGYENEADPQVMARKIDAAADHGIGAFIFDWYWYDDGPFLERGLEEGYLRAPNNQRLKFCCMWANHDWQNIHPAKLRNPQTAQFPGKVRPATFQTATNHVIERYFAHPAHLLVDGCPYFSFYDLGQLLASFGSVPATRVALDDFRARTKAAGFADLHLNAVVWGQPILPGESVPADPVQLVRDLGFDSVTSYVWVHHVWLRDHNTIAYEQIRDEYFGYWEKADQQFSRYFPNVSLGWDPSPRTLQTDVWDCNAGYPWTPAIVGDTPAAYQAALQKAADKLRGRAGQQLLTLNAWNEWTEGSYLEPDTEYGYGYLEAIRSVFGAR